MSRKLAAGAPDVDDAALSADPDRPNNAKLSKLRESTAARWESGVLRIARHAEHADRIGSA